MWFRFQYHRTRCDSGLEYSAESIDCPCVPPVLPAALAVAMDWTHAAAPMVDADSSFAEHRRGSVGPALESDRERRGDERRHATKLSFLSESGHGSS